MYLPAYQPKFMSVNLPSDKWSFLWQFGSAQQSGRVDGIPTTDLGDDRIYLINNVIQYSYLISLTLLRKSTHNKGSNLGGSGECKPTMNNKPWVGYIVEDLNPNEAMFNVIVWINGV